MKLLKSSLGGNSMVVLGCCVAEDHEMLKFGQRTANFGVIAGKIVKEVYKNSLYVEV